MNDVDVRQSIIKHDVKLHDVPAMYAMVSLDDREKDLLAAFQGYEFADLDKALEKLQPEGVAIGYVGSVLPFLIGLTLVLIEVAVMIHGGEPDQVVTVIGVSLLLTGVVAPFAMRLLKNIVGLANRERRKLRSIPRSVLEDWRNEREVGDTLKRVVLAVDGTSLRIIHYRSEPPEAMLVRTILPDGATGCRIRERGDGSFNLLVTSDNRRIVLAMQGLREMSEGFRATLVGTFPIASKAVMPEPDSLP